MRPRFLAPAAFALAGALACQAAGAGTSQPSEPATLAPRTAAHVAALMQPPLDSPGEGRRMFLKLNCYSCHGIFAGGAIGPNIVGAPFEEVQSNVLNGNGGGMPSFAKYVNDTDILNLANYLESIGTEGEPKFMDWWKKNPKK